MKVVQSLLLAALVVVLAVIAVDLHRLTAFVVPSAAARAAARVSNDIPAETREQRIARMRHEIDELAAVLTGVLADPKPTPPAAGPKHDRPTR